MADFDEREGLVVPSFSEGGEIIDPYASDEGAGTCELKY